MRGTRASLLLVLVLLLSSALNVHCGGYHGGYGGYGGGYQQVKKNPYVPSPPGETPTCAKGGLTYCEKIETYPMKQIWGLLQKYGTTYKEFITNENMKEYVPNVQKEYGPPTQSPQHLPYDSYFPKHEYGAYLPPQQGNYTGDYNYRKREPSSGAYDYSYSIPQGSGGQSSSDYALFAAAIPPILHSIWWNHRDSNGHESYPYINQYRQNHRNQGWGRWKRRVKRQTAENRLCPIHVRYISPEAAMNNEGNWMYVVNMGPSSQFRQMVKTEVCTGSNSPCNNVCSVAPGQSATCKQQYIQKRLVALGDNGQGLQTQVFWIPHCCECQIT